MNFRAADLIGAHLVNANMPSAILDQADLRRAGLTGASFINCSMRGTQLQAQCLRGVDLSKTNMDEANLTNADLRHIKAMAASCKSAVFIRATLTATQREQVMRGKAVMSKPPNSQFLDGFPMIMSRPASARTESSAASRAWQ